MLTTLPTTIYKDLALQAGAKDHMPYQAGFSISYSSLDIFVALIEERYRIKQRESTDALQKMLP